MPSHLIFRLLTIALLFSLLFSVGCGPRSRVPINYVAGEVTLDGTPTKGIIVRFIPSSDDAGYEGATGITDEKGIYKLSSYNGLPEKGGMAGEFKVTFSYLIMKKFDKPVYDEMSGTWVKETGVNGVAAKYQTPATTPFTVNVVKGRNKLDFAITSK